MAPKSSSLTLKILTDASAAVKGFKQTEKALGGVTKKSDKFAGIMKKGLVPAIGALAGAGALIGKGVKGIAADEKALNNLNSTLAATGNAAKLNVKGFQEYAGALQDTTGYGADVITQGAAMLATFKNVRNEVGKGNQIFDRATAAGLDLARKGFGNPEQNAILLGKALNDPIKGITALTRQGITFTDSQKDMIKKLVESGNALDAQKLIMKEIEGQVKGTADAYGKTMAGKMEIAQRRFEEVQKAIAQMVIPALTRLLEIGSKVLKWFQDNSTVAKALTITVVGFSGAIVAANVAMRAYTAALGVAKVAQIALNVAMKLNPIGIVVTALAGLTAGIVIAYKNSETFREMVQKVWEWLETLGGWLTGVGTTVFNGLKSGYEAIQPVVDTFITAIKWLWNTGKTALTWYAGRGTAYFNGLKTAFNAIKEVIEPVKTALSWLWSTGKTAINWFKGSFAFTSLQRAFDGIKTTVQAIVNALRWISENIQNVLNSLNPLGKKLPPGYRNPLAPRTTTRSAPYQRSTTVNVALDAPTQTLISEEQVTRALVRLLQRSDARNGLAFSL